MQAARPAFAPKSGRASGPEAKDRRGRALHYDLAGGTATEQFPVHATVSGTAYWDDAALAGKSGSIDIADSARSGPRSGPRASPVRCPPLNGNAQIPQLQGAGIDADPANGRVVPCAGI
jgi:hypothetical protein